MKHSGEELDIKPYEADMRHLLNAYIQADPAADLAELADAPLTELIIETGIHDAIARKLNEKGKLSRNAVAEAIINNVRKTIIRDQLTDPRFYNQMSKLLDDLIKQSRADTAAYEEFLRKALPVLARSQSGAERVAVEGGIVESVALSGLMDQDPLACGTGRTYTRPSRTLPAVLGLDDGIADVHFRWPGRSEAACRALRLTHTKEGGRGMPKISGSFAGRATMQTAAVIPDSDGHELSLAEVEGPQKSSDPLWSDVRITYWGSADLVAGNGPQRGYWMNRHAHGETDWGTFEGKITTAGGQTTMEGTYKWTGGTGKFKGISGGGKYKGRFTSPTEVTNDWDGEYHLA